LLKGLRGRAALFKPLNLSKGVKVMARRLSSPDEILKAALEKERQACDFYGNLASGCSVDFVRDLLEKLQNEESRHVKVIEEMIQKLEAGRDIA